MNIYKIGLSIPNINKISKKQSMNLYKYSQIPDTFECTNLSFRGKANDSKEYNKVVNALTTTYKNAQTSFNGQLAMDGWAGKVADSVSILWNSKNRAKLVQEDLDTYKKQINDLDNSVKNDNFKNKFKEIFGVEYDNVAISQYNKKVQDFQTAVTTSCMAEITKTKLKDSLKTFSENDGVLKDKTEKKINVFAPTGTIPNYIETPTADEIFNKMEEDLVEVVGSKNVLDDILKSHGMDVEKASKSDKYKAYGMIADYLVETSNLTAKKCCKDKSLKDLKQEYEKAYHKAYGEKNDIQERVDKYNRSQEIGAAAVRGATRAGLMAATMLIAPPAGIGKIAVGSVATFGIKVAVDGSDKLSNSIDNSYTMDSKAVKKLLRSSALSAAEYFASGGLGMIIPNLDTSNELLNWGFKQAKGVVLDVTTGMVTERFKQGKWCTNQIIPRMIISATFRNLGPDSELVKQLLKMSKSGINQAMKKTTRDYDIVKQFIEGTKVELNKEYLKDNKTYSELKILATQDPDAYEEMILGILDATMDEIKE